MRALSSSSSSSPTATGASTTGVALGLTVAAGLATVLGGLVVFSRRLVHLANPTSLAVALAISAGVMLFISLAEIYGESVHRLHEGLRARHPGLADGPTAAGHAQLAASGCFALGLVVVYGIDALVHRLSPPVHDCAAEYEGIAELRESFERHEAAHDEPHPDLDHHKALQSPSQPESIVSLDPPAHKDPHGRGPHERQQQHHHHSEHQRKLELRRMSLLSALALGLHNLPEGIATYVAAKQNSTVGFSLAVGIGLHNIPEGIAVAAPVYFATGSRARGIAWCAISAVAEPLGGLLAWLALGDGLSPTVEGILFGAIAGIMVGISIKELLPTAYRLAGPAQRQHLIALGAFGGMFVMIASLVLFGYAGA